MSDFANGFITGFMSTILLVNVIMSIVQLYKK